MYLVNGEVDGGGGGECALITVHVLFSVSPCLHILLVPDSPSSLLATVFNPIICFDLCGIYFRKFHHY